MRTWPALEPRSHVGSLSTLATAALREGRYDEAVLLADRRCRIGPPADANDFLLRASALSGAGFPSQAARDLTHALELDPDNGIANSWLLNSPVSTMRVRAARTLVGHDGSPERIRKALSVLAAEGFDVAGHLAADADGVTGWFAWRGGEPLSLRVRWRDGAEILNVSAEAHHPFAALLGSAAHWHLPWRDEGDAVEITPVGGRLAISERVFLRPEEPHIFSPMQRVAHDHTSPVPAVAIIIPVHGQGQATRNCLDSLFDDDVSRTSHRIIVVDDASPDPDVAELLAPLATQGRIELIREPLNQGFARSINRALRITTREDVLLLNSDTVVPPGFLDRLRAAAYAEPDIGTVTPLSNNGEYTSFPIPFKINPLPGAEALRELDQAAAAANPTQMIDLPSGIGFCLYVRRACVDAIGGLRSSYGRGYYEDVDFCLRAAAAGFRNVCASNVYVGHAGSQSFGAEKRALVVRNLRKIERAYPDYQPHSAQFVAQDPLHPARCALEKRLPRREPLRLAVFGQDASEHQARYWLSHLNNSERPTLVAKVATDSEMVTVSIATSDGTTPQNVRFTVSHGDVATLTNDFSALSIASIVLFGTEALPDVVTGALAALGRPIRHHRDKPLTTARKPAACHASRRPADGRIRVGLVSVDRKEGTLHELIPLLQAIAGAPDVEPIVLGSTFDDLFLMAETHVFVTGRVAPDELSAALERFRLTHLFVPGKGDAFATWSSEISEISLPTMTQAELGDGDAQACASALLRWVRKEHAAAA